MSDEREFNEMNEQELKKASGGGTEEVQIHYRCPVCGTDKYIPCSMPRIVAPACMYCYSQTGKQVLMERLNR